MAMRGNVDEYDLVNALGMLRVSANFTNDRTILAARKKADLLATLALVRKRLEEAEAIVKALPND